MSLPRFLLVNLAGAIWSVPLLVWLGAWGGARVEELAARVAWLKIAALGVAVIVAAGVAARRWRR
jgi:membrane protein DedA with SNARE-associated domain